MAHSAQDEQHAALQVAQLRKTDLVPTASGYAPGHAVTTAGINDRFEVIKLCP